MKLIPALISKIFPQCGLLSWKSLLIAGPLLSMLSGSLSPADAQRFGVTIVTPPAIPFVSPVIFDAPDMNSNGDVVGTTGNNIYRAFSWTFNNTSPFDPGFARPFDFSSSDGHGISDAGDFVGIDGYSRPYVFHTSSHSGTALKTGKIPVPGLPGQFSVYFGNGGALAVNSIAGFIVGWGSPVKPGDSFASSGKHAYAWPVSGLGEFIDMGDGDENSTARSINSLGHAAGEINTGTYQDIHGTTHILTAGFVQNIISSPLGFSSSGKALLPSLGGEQSTVRQINDSDQVVGSSQTADGVFHACLWTSGSPLFTAANLDPSNAAQSVANSINSAGVVVGQRWFGGYRGFLWDSVHGQRDLNTMIPDGWSCYQALKINDNGQILAYCVFNGTFNVVVLTPQPTPTLSGLNPSTVAGATAVSPFTVTGTNFTASSKIHVHQVFPGGTLDQDLATTFDSPTQLHTSIPATLLTHTDNVAVTVLDPVRGPTGSLTLTVTQGAIPTLTGVTPNTVPVGTAVPKLTVTGTNFKAASKIHLYQITGFNGSDFTFINLDLPTTYDSANQLHTSIPANLLSLYSGAYITVIDPILGAGPGLPLSVVGVPKISISSVVATRTAGPGSPLSVLINFANTGTADALNATVSAASQLKLNGVNTTTATPFTIDAIYTGQGILVTFPGSILPGNRVLSLTMSYDGGSFNASKLVVIP